MSGTDAISRKPLTLLDFKTREDVAQLAKGSDSDVGGRSTAALALEADPADAGVLANGGRPYARFWGDMRTAVSPEMQGRLRGGYAGFRNKVRPLGSWACCGRLNGRRARSTARRCSGR